MLYVTAAGEQLPGVVTLLLPYLGIPGTMLAVLVYALAKGWLITGREAAKDRAACSSGMQGARERIEELKREKEDQRKELESRLYDMRNEKDMWRSQALDNMRALERTSEMTREAMEHVARGHDRDENKKGREDS